MSCVPWAHDKVQVDTNLAVGVGLVCIAYTKDIIRRSRSLIFVNGQSACLCSFFFLLVSYQGKMCVTIHVPARAEWALYSLQYRWPTACIYKPQNCCAWQLLQLQNCQQTVFLTDNFFVDCQQDIQKFMSLSQPCCQLYNLFTGPLLFVCHVVDNWIVTTISCLQL